MGASLLTLFLDLGWATGFTHDPDRAHRVRDQLHRDDGAGPHPRVRLDARGRVDWTSGASPTRTFFKVTLPLIVPGIVAAAMLSFALSLDDFIITYFVSGSTVTYPLYVNAAAKAAVPPQINVLATAILVISLILLAVGTLYRRKRES